MASAACGMGGGFGHATMGSMHGGGSPFLMLLKSANLTPAQQSQVQLILNSDKAQLQGLHQQLFALHEQISAKLLGAGPVSAADLRPLIQQASRIEADLNQNMADTALAIRNILTPQQHARDPLPDEMVALIERAGGGDRRAVEMLIGRYRQRIARFVIAQTGDEAHYEDLSQTVFVKVVLALPRLRSPARFEAWLFQIARNVCRDHLRARAGWRRLFVSYEPAHEIVALPEPDADAGDAIARSIEQLPEPQRAILRLSLDSERSMRNWRGRRAQACPR
jgi:RNA polymerase sigma-70 factor (ECF subfamily)